MMEKVSFISLLDLNQIREVISRSDKQKLLNTNISPVKTWFLLLQRGDAPVEHQQTGLARRCP